MLNIVDLSDVKFSKTEQRTYFLRLEFSSRNLDIEVVPSDFSEIAGGLFELMLNYKCSSMSIELLRERVSRAPLFGRQAEVADLSKGELEDLLVSLLMSNVNDHFKSLLNDG